MKKSNLLKVNPGFFETLSKKKQMEILKRGAEDFAKRFEGVMKELAEN